MKKVTILAGIFVLLIAIGLFAAFELHQTITIDIDGEEQTVSTWAWTVGDALFAAGIPVAEGDIVTPAVDDRLPDDGQVSIERAFWVSITADGQTQSLWTTERQPQKLLDMATVNLGLNDKLLWNGLPVLPEKRLPQALSHCLQIQKASTVKVTENGQQQQFFSTGSTLGQALWDEGITLSASDQLEPGLDTPLQGSEIAAELQRSREISIQHAGGKVQARVIADNVGKALAQAGMPLQGLDYSIPPEEAPIPISNTIQVVRVHEEVILETEPLPFGSLTQPLDDVELDTQQVIQVGEYGLTAKRVRIVYEDGVEVARQTEDEWTAREPKPRILGYGTRINIRTLQTPDGPIEYWRAVEVYGSTYSPCRSGGDKCYPNTSSGKPVQKGVIAVTLDWYRYMQGLPAYVPNYGFGTIEDVGGGLPDRHWIDLGYSDEDWEGWGGWMTIYFLTPVPANIMWILE
jgi:resuscitation-promoting factor RpfB